MRKYREMHTGWRKKLKRKVESHTLRQNEKRTMSDLGDQIVSSMSWICTTLTSEHL